MPVNDYSTTPASNGSISSINIAEGCPPAGINDAIRQVLADIAGWRTGSVGTLFTGGGTMQGSYTFSGPVTLSSTVTLSSPLAVVQGGTGVTTSTGTGSVVLSNSPVLVTPTLGAASATSIANSLGAVGTPSFTFTGDLNTGMWSPGADTLAFSEGGVEAMRITSAGYVGIGTTAPPQLLAVGGSTDQFGAGVTGAVTTAYFGSPSSGSGGIRRLAYDRSTGNFDFIGGSVASPSTQMTITSWGNVGIGTTSPGERLTVSGNISATGNVAAAGSVSAGGIELGYRDLPVVGSLTRGACFPTSAGITIDTATAGNLFTIYNDSAVAITLTQGAGVTLRLAGTTMTGNRTLAARGFANVWYRSASEAAVSGSVS